VYHVAEKKIPFAGPDGTTAVPKANNGIKLESFIFDVFPRAERPVVLEVRVFCSRCGGPGLRKCTVQA
jgi:UDP-N-acetylglucosamine/UDP-N-acetylgalactosamine diphosphorylase